MKDQLFKKEMPASYKFKFDASVAAVFDDMLVRSIPFYEEVKRMVGELCQTFFQSNTAIYDLGCSTGVGLYELARQLGEAHGGLIGVDSSEAMIEKAKQRLSALPNSYDVTLHCEDLLTTVIQNASIVVMDYTLQFIDQEARPEFLSNLYEGLLPGGVLILSEKVKTSNDAFEPHQVDYYEAFKKRNGYSELEIARKRKSLEDVLVAYTLEQNLALLEQAGFQKVEVVFKWYNFVTLLAQKV